MSITHSNFTEYALENYRFTKNSTRDEFQKDLSNFAKINRYMREAVVEKDFTNMLCMINLVVIVFNVFGTVAATKMLAFKVDKGRHRQLKALLIATGRYAGSVEFKAATPCVRFYRKIEAALADR